MCNQEIEGTREESQKKSFLRSARSWSIRGNEREVRLFWSFRPSSLTSFRNFYELAANFIVRIRNSECVLGNSIVYKVG